MTRQPKWSAKKAVIDLTSRTIITGEIDPEWIVKYLGGRGFGVRVLYDEISPGLEPLSPDNPIIIAPGCLDGTLSPGSGRCTVLAKSPLTGILGRSSVGGTFGSELRWAGYDLLVIKGASTSPVYLWITDDNIEIRDAWHLWGMDTWTAQAEIHRELGDSNISTLKIGPAGENQCLSSAIIGDLSRAAAKCAIGAVWGTKKLKAVAVRGHQGTTVAHPDRLIELSLALWTRFKHDPMYATHTKYGRNSWVGDSVMRSSGRFLRNNSADALYALYERNVSCRGCALRCAHYYHLRNGSYAGTSGGGIEGNCQLVGLSLGVDDGAFLLHYNSLCNRLGINLDLPSIAIGWAMRLYQDGIITINDTDGLELKPGNQEAFLKMVRKIANREGFGEVLDGYPFQAVRKLGRGSENYISHNKGGYSGGPGFMSSVKTTLAHAVATRGHDHLTGSPGIETPDYQPQITREILNKVGQERYGDPQMYTAIDWTAKPKYALRVYDCENLFAIGDATGTCRAVGQSLLFVTGIGITDYRQLLQAVIGNNLSENEVIKIAERVLVLERVFNAREGIRRIDDYPHAFWWQLKNDQPHPKYERSRYRMSLEDYEHLLDSYYLLRGCNPATGIPLRSKLVELGLSDVARDLEQHHVLSDSESTTC